MKSTECLTELFESLNAGTVIITPNKRLSRFVQSQYANFMAAKGVSAWPTLPCYSLSGWYYDLWDKLQFVDSSAARLRVMSASHEKGIWQKIIEANSDALELFNISAAASVARSAWNTLVEWQHDPCSLQDNDAKYTLWAQQYQSYCEGRSLTDSARMVNYLCTSIESGVLSIPANLVLLAFDELTPQTTRLLKVVTGQGSTIQQCDTGIARTKVARIALGDFDSEVNSAARWAANIIEREPDASVGIVIENLAASRAKVEGIFTSVFEPQYILPDRQCHASGFNISAAQPLATTPPVAAALRALRLNFRELDIEEISHFLHSPFISCLSELPARAQLEHELREQALKIRMSHLRTRAGDFGVKKAGQDKRETTLESTHEATLETTPETIQKAAPKQTKPTGELYKSLHAFHQTTLVLPKVCSASE
ncbi:MAG: ATP-dependent helicase/nuclease subunit B, partial [Lentisphaeria bacterium]